jgi:hypothetical protein
MKARLYAVQRALWALVIVSAALAILAFPRGNNGAYSAALAELEAFEKGFKQAELERSLLAYAQAQGIVPLADVAALVRGPLVPAVKAAPAAPPILPLARLELRTLADIQARSQKGSSLPIGAPTPEPLAAALAWRLARAGGTGYSLVGTSLLPAQLSAADVEREREVARLRLESRSAEQAVAEATKKLATAEELFEARRKRKLPWKILVKSDEARKEARVLLGERQRGLDDIRARYEAVTKQAEASANDPAAVSGEHALPSEFAIAQVLLDDAAAVRTMLKVPVALAIRPVNLPTLAGTDFAATRAAGLWEEVKNGSASAAIGGVQGRFTWHHRSIELAGMHIAGSSVLHALPCLLPFLLFAVLTRIRRVSVSYNPFGASVDIDLPRVGLGSRTVELVALVILPLTAVALTGAALWAVSQLPVVPILVGLACLGLGTYAFLELGTLQNLVEAVVRSHSSRPPEDSTSEGHSAA